ncbi:MAG: hypothetical protein P8Z36_15320, partial [Gemmatimonadota bacterium]
MNRRAHFYVWLLFAAAIASAISAQWSGFGVLSNDDLVGLAVFLGLAVLANVTGFDFTVGHYSVGSRISFVPIFAAALFY